MRLMTWNCRVGGFRNKAERVARFRPDVLVVQELEPIDSVLLFSGQDQPTCRDRVGDPAYPKRAIGMFSYTGMGIIPVDTTAPLYGFRRYEARYDELTFHVVGVWTAETDSRQTAYMQAHEGLRLHADWIGERPTVMLGDFNDNESYRSANWQQLLDLTRPLGLVSAYHTYFAEPFGAESRPTYFHGGKETAPFHLDYCFLPDAWAPHITQVEVGRYQDWRTLSDHAPLIVDLDLPSLSGGLFGETNLSQNRRVVQRSPHGLMPRSRPSAQRTIDPPQPSRSEKIMNIRRRTALRMPRGRAMAP